MFLKSIFDRTASFFGLIFLFPILIIVGILIRIKMPGGPVIFKQRRVGRHGKLFTMYKFRSMTVSHSGSSVSVRGENRITPLGAKLRKYKLDELLELWNVLIGDMSFVGPGPVLPGIPYAEYDDVRRKRLTVRPGITGYSQAYFRNSVGQEEKFLQDCYYTDHVSLLFDLKILFHTAYSVLKRENVFVKDKKAE